MKRKLLICVADGMDHFINPLASYLQKDYDIRKTSNLQDKEPFEWADILWFEFAEKHAEFFSKHRAEFPNKPAICRLHGYELREGWIQRINWEAFTSLVLVGERMKDWAQIVHPKINQQVKITIINNGVDLEEFVPSDNLDMKKIAWVGNFYTVKNPQLALQILAHLPKEYTLHFALGKSGDPNIFHYMSLMPKHMKLQDRVFFTSNLPHNKMPEWLSDKGILLSTSLHESFSLAVAEAAAIGAYPLVHDFPFNGVAWPEEMLYKTAYEAVTKIEAAIYPHLFRKLIEENYSFEKQVRETRVLLDKVSNVKV